MHATLALWRILVLVAVLCGAVLLLAMEIDAVEGRRILGGRVGATPGSPVPDGSFNHG